MQTDGDGSDKQNTTEGEGRRGRRLGLHTHRNGHTLLALLHFEGREGPSLQPNTFGIITPQSKTRLAKRPTHKLGKNNIRAGALEKSPAFM